MNNNNLRSRQTAYNKKVGLVLQGGGALGSYQAGVYEALASSPYQPDWVAGISIGAINAALIAGNPPEKRVTQLRRFWETVTAPTAWWPAGLTGPAAAYERYAGGFASMMFGQPGFFAPRQLEEWYSPNMPTSFYSTAALKGTLEELVDFDRINSTGGTRLSVGAVNVSTGRFAYFDSAEIAIRPEHVMASGALPPGFPPVEIDGEYYWDGGLVSNTPLDYLVEYSPRCSRLIFQVDVFQGHGQTPRNLEEVSEREKDIRFSSRTRITTDFARKIHEARHAINELMEILPPALRNTEQAKRLYELGCVTEMDIVQLIYRPNERQGSCKDYEFSRVTMNDRWQRGLSDARTTLQSAPWLAIDSHNAGVRVYDVIHDLLVGAPKATPEATSPMEEHFAPRLQEKQRRA